MLGEVQSDVETSLLGDDSIPIYSDIICYRLSKETSGGLVRYPKGCGIFGVLQKKRQWQRLVAEKNWLEQLKGFRNLFDVQKICKKNIVKILEEVAVSSPRSRTSSA